MVDRLVVIFTMRPQPDAISAGAAARDMKNVPTTLVSMIRRQTSGSASQKRRLFVPGAASRCAGPLPALLTRICRPPKSLSVSATVRSQSSLRVMSQGMPMALPQPSRKATSATAPPVAPALMSAKTTLAPARTMAWAMARPRPAAAPVTMATRPSRRMSEASISAPRLRSAPRRSWRRG